jgi:hypothetical protein
LVQVNIVGVDWVAGRDDFLSHGAPMRKGIHHVDIIVEVIRGASFFTVQQTSGIMLQPDFGWARATLTASACMG